MTSFMNFSDDFYSILRFCWIFFFFHIKLFTSPIDEISSKACCNSCIVCKTWPNRKKKSYFFKFLAFFYFLSRFRVFVCVVLKLCYFVEYCVALLSSLIFFFNIWYFLYIQGFFSFNRFGQIVQNEENIEFLGMFVII